MKVHHQVHTQGEKKKEKGQECEDLTTHKRKAWLLHSLGRSGGHFGGVWNPEDIVERNPQNTASIESVFSLVQSGNAEVCPARWGLDIVLPVTVQPCVVIFPKNGDEFWSTTQVFV